MRLVGLFIFMLCVGSFSAQQYFFKHYSVRDGLPQSQVLAVQEDDLGFLWVATNGGGVCRFDGNEFTVFDEGDSLAGDIVTDIEIGQRGGNLFQ